MIDYTLFATDKKGNEKLIVEKADANKYMDAMHWAHNNGFCGFRTVLFDPENLPDIKKLFSNTVKV